MSFPLSCIDLRLKNISSIDELAEITFAIINTLEVVFELKQNWQQAAPDGIVSGAQGLVPFQINDERDLARFFTDRGWEKRFSGDVETGTGSFYNETIIVQIDPEEFSINFEQSGPEKSGEWRITVKAPNRKLDRNLFLKCAMKIYTLNEMRDGSIRCSYNTSQEQIGKYIPRPLVEEVFIHNIGKIHSVEKTRS